MRCGHELEKRIGCEVHETECKELSSELVQAIAADADVDLAGRVLHADNGGPMKGSTMVATLQRLGVIASFSRPHVSDDNANCTGSPHKRAALA